VTHWYRLLDSKHGALGSILGAQKQELFTRELKRKKFFEVLIGPIKKEKDFMVGNLSNSA
jgi:hypothetical protein